MDKVIIRNLLARGIIGINDWERKRAQDILINLILFTDTHRGANRIISTIVLTTARCRRKSWRTLKAQAS